MSADDFKDMMAMIKPLEFKSGRREWNPERLYIARLMETWAPYACRSERWVVTDLWKFEQGSGRELLAVTIERAGRERRMSQSRFVATFVKVE